MEYRIYFKKKTDECECWFVGEGSWLLTQRLQPYQRVVQPTNGVNAAVCRPRSIIGHYCHRVSTDGLKPSSEAKARHGTTSCGRNLLLLLLPAADARKLNKSNVICATNIENSRTNSTFSNDFNALFCRHVFRRKKSVVGFLVESTITSLRSILLANEFINKGSTITTKNNGRYWWFIW